MPATTVSSGRAAARPAGRAAGRKSPLRVVTEVQPLIIEERPDPGEVGDFPGLGPSPGLTAAQLRRLMISEFRDWLGSRTNRNGRPFQADTISAYADAAIALDAWMSADGIDADFTACDTELLNRFFAAYFAAHGQGGTNTKQRNLRHLFSWREREHDHPHPYTDDLQRYTPAKTRPSTLAGQFITDLLEVTGNGRARGSEDARDHAMIRMLTEGVRRTELVQRRRLICRWTDRDRAAVRAGGAFEGCPRVHRGADRAVGSGDGAGASGVSAGAAGAPAGGVAWLVAGDPEPGGDHRVGAVPAASAASRGGRV